MNRAMSFGDARSSVRELRKNISHVGCVLVEVARRALLRDSEADKTTREDRDALLDMLVVWHDSEALVECAHQELDAIAEDDERIAAEERPTKKGAQKQ